MKKVLLLLTFLVSLTHAVGLNLNTASSSSATAQAVDISGAIISMPSVNSSTIYAMPTTKSGYTPQIDSINPKTGTITFRVYDETNWFFLNGIRSYENNALKKVLSLSDDANKEIDSIVSARENQLENRSNQAVKKYYDDLSAYKTQLDGLFEKMNSTSTNGSYFKEFLSLSKFVVACLTLDNTVINIEQSMSTKSMVLQSRYSMNIGDSLTTAQNSQSASLANAKLQEYIKKFSIKTFFFVLEWQKENNKLIQQIKMFMIGIFLPLTIGYTGLTKLTKYAQKISDFDDLGEKGIVLVIIFVIFFIPSTIYNKGDSSNQMSQTRYQSWAVDIARKGVGFADRMTINTISSYSQWQMNNLGIVSNEDLKTAYTAQVKTKLNHELYDTIFQNQCTGKYDFTKLAEIHSYIQNNDMIFFSDDEFKTAQKNWEKKERTPFPFGNQALLWRSSTMPTLSLTACSQLERDLRILKNDMKEYEAFNAKLENMKNGDVSNDVALLTTINSDGMSYATSLGFMYAPFILMQDYFVQNITDDSSPLSSVKNNERFRDFQDDKFKSSVIEWLKDSYFPNDIAFGYIADYAGEKMVTILKAMPYKVIPFYSPIQDSIYIPIHNAMLLATDSIIGKSLSLADVFMYAISTYTAYQITDSVLQFTPAFVMIVAGVWGFVFYAISLFIYYYVSPFLLAYALGAQQTEALRSFISRGVVLAFKPIMLVMSVVVALVAVDLTQEILSFTEDVIMQNLISTYDVSGWKFIMFTFFQGLFHVISLVVKSAMAFVLVFKGTDIIMALFGFKESGVNVKEVIGGDIERSTGKYTGQ